MENSCFSIPHNPVPFLLKGLVLARRPLQEMLLTGLTLAFATIPEELPILITIVLGLGAYRLAKEHAIVKRLRATETLGSVSVIGTDKTGTLTENRVHVAQISTADGVIGATGDGAVSECVRRLLEIGILASDSQAQRLDGRVEFVGDPTETALLAAAEESGLSVQHLRETIHVVHELPFDDVRKHMSVVVERDGARWLALKGSPESVLAVCDNVNGAVQAQAEGMAAGGLRVLAFAERRLEPGETPTDDPAVVEHDLRFVAWRASRTPPRREVPAAIADLKAAGVRVLMLTGDHPATARAIAERVGIDAHRVVRGRELEGLSDTQLGELAATTSVFARIAPEHKLRLVRALQDRGEVVAVTGDGVNDGPALRDAAVGVAMGRAGTDVAREAADLVLAVTLNAIWRILWLLLTLDDWITQPRELSV